MRRFWRCDYAELDGAQVQLCRSRGRGSPRCAGRYDCLRRSREGDWRASQKAADALMITIANSGKSRPAGIAGPAFETMLPVVMPELPPITAFIDDVQRILNSKQ